VLLLLLILPPSPGPRQGFDNNYDPCDDTDFFKGLACSGNPGDADRKVTQIWLSAMMLNGTLPEDIGKMNKMVQL
jgi:hypothetical protein